jgi:hypothetical protein
MVTKQMIDEALLDRSEKIVHCIEITPGAYLVSPSLANEIRKRSAETMEIGNMFGITIMTSDLLPMRLADGEEEKPKAS